MVPRRRSSLAADRRSVSCSFCGKDQTEVFRLVGGPGVHICDECVGLCQHIIVEERGRSGGSGHPAPSRVPADLQAWEELSDDDLLTEMVRANGAHESVDRAVARHVAVLRERGVSWARIGDALGIARQSAWERFSGED